VRVTYWSGLNERYSEWICPEHTGFARMKFEKWFLARRASDDVKVPATVDDFLELEFMGMVRKTKDITIRRVAGERYPDIIASTPGDLPDNSPFREGAFSEEDFDDLPF
jgi:DNA repair protein RadD